jgi:hypothetical protein
MGEGVGALGGREGVEGVANGMPEGVDGSGCGGAEQRLELSEDLLDRVIYRWPPRPSDQFES